MEYERLSPSLIEQKNFNAKVPIQSPDPSLFLLPEKILQFGTGALLRGLPDYFIDKANKKGVFNGRIVVVKSSVPSGAEGFKAQGGLYIQNVRGIKNDKNIDEYIVNTSISRVLEAQTQWGEILNCASNKDLTIIISNTTEVGITLSNDNIHNSPPSSFPGKLTAFLFNRFRIFNGSPESGLIIIPTELIIDNGLKLKRIIIELARKSDLGEAFISWIEKHNTFCNSLVDRIISGKPDPYLREEIYNDIGFHDDLLIISEPYKLWAIEGDNKVKDKLSFSKTDKSIIIQSNIQPYKERKLRLLNGTQTIIAGLGFLAGLDTIDECMNDTLMSEFTKNIMTEEIIPSMDTERKKNETFANDVIERFRNPFLTHHLINLTLNYTHKMNVRNAETIINFYKKFMEVPRHFALGFASYILFMKAEKVENNRFYGKRDDEFYLITDDKASYFYDKWKKADVNTINCCRKFVEEVIDDDSIWDTELKSITGFSDAIAHSLFELLSKGIKETLEEFVEFGEIEE